MSFNIKSCSIVHKQHLGVLKVLTQDNGFPCHKASKSIFSGNYCGVASRGKFLAKCLAKVSLRLLSSEGKTVFNVDVSLVMSEKW